MAALKRAQIHGCLIVAVQKEAPTALNLSLSVAQTSLACPGQKNSLSCLHDVYPLLFGWDINFPEHSLELLIA